MKYCIIVHYHELSLKGKNRPWFQKKLILNIRKQFTGLEFSNIKLIASRIIISDINKEKWQQYKAILKCIIGVKRNAERYMFSEPRAPVDAARARIRESRFYIRNAQAVVNFFAILVNKWLLGPKIPFLPRIRILGPKTDFGRRNALFRPKSLFGQKGPHFHSFSIGFISIRGMGTQKCIFV